MSKSSLAALAALCLSATACQSSMDVATATSPDPVAVAADASLGAGGGAVLAVARRATAAYHDVSRAVADGFVVPGAEACVVSPAGAMGVHAVHPGRASDTVIDAERPEALLYLPMPGGTMRLVGVEYIQPVLVRNRATGQVSPWFAPTPWPSTYEEVTSRPSVLGQPFDGPMPPHEAGTPWHYDLHVWAWAPNPAGDFAPFNPRLDCHGEAH